MSSCSWGWYIYRLWWWEMEWACHKGIMDCFSLTLVIRWLMTRREGNEKLLPEITSMTQIKTQHHTRYIISIWNYTEWDLPLKINKLLTGRIFCIEFGGMTSLLHPVDVATFTSGGRQIWKAAVKNLSFLSNFRVRGWFSNIFLLLSA